jgi:hypothetical protein
MKNTDVLNKVRPTYLNDTQDSYVELVKVAEYESIPTEVSKKNLLTCKLKGSKEKYYFLAELEQVCPKNLIREYQSKYVTKLISEKEIA